MANFMTRFRKPIPEWLGTTLRVALWAAVALGLLLGFGAWYMGMLMNLLLIVLMGAVVVLGLSRLIRLMTGGLKLSDWRLPKTRSDFGPFIHMFARVGFWAMATAIVSTSIILIQFTAGEAKEINLTILFCGVFAIAMSLLPKASRRRPMTVFALLAMMFFTVEFARIYSFETPAKAVSIASPFKGEAYVFQGGPSALLNHHYPYKNQTHALDLVILDENGRSISENADYAADPCMGMPLYAPVAGEVVDVVTGLEDDEALKKRGESITGNRIVIDNGQGVYILLAHLQKGSLKVDKGERVKQSQEIAACGNSGNSSGPHLHLQAQTTVLFEDPDIRSLPMTFTNASRIRGEKIASGAGLTYRRNDIIRPIGP